MSSPKIQQIERVCIYFYVCLYIYTHIYSTPIKVFQNNVRYMYWFQKQRTKGQTVMSLSHSRVPGSFLPVPQKYSIHMPVYSS